MRKILVLILALPLMAASCDSLLDFGGGGGLRGVLKSEDGGETFNAFNVVSPKGSLSSVNANSMVFDTSNPDVLYLGSSTGIYKTEDGGKSWRFILSGITVADVAIDPFAANIVYAAGITGTNGKIIKSLDAGTSWVDVYTEPSKNNPALSIAVSPSNPSLVIAGLSNGEIIRSNDGGQTWQSSTDLADRIMKLRFGSNSEAYVLSARKGVGKSNDGGSTWSQSSNSLTEHVFSDSNNPISSVTAFYDLALDKRQVGVIYLGTEQGLFRSVDNGTNWSLLALPLKNSGLRVSSVAVNPSNSNSLFASVGSTIFHSVNGGVTWETKVLPTTSEVRTILINPQSNNLIYLGLANKR